MGGYNFIKVPQKVPFVRTRYRRIKTMIPTPSTLVILKELDKYEARSMHGQLPVLWDRAKDFQVFDTNGNCWIDFTSTIFVANSGHSNSKVIRALDKQLKQGLLHTYTFPSQIRAKFLKKLIEITPAFCEKAFLLSAGTEATECAVKLMRLYGQSINPSKIGIISFKGSMHGRTMAAEMLKDDQQSSEWIGYRDPNMYSLPFPYPWTAEGSQSNNYDWKARFTRDINNLKENGLDFRKVCGFMVESYIGWGAVMFPKPYIQALVDFAKRYNILLTFDEIQGGFGRTGKFFTFQHYGVKPDLICLGKALSGGLPLSAVVGRRKIMDLPEVGSMSSTHSANPLSCAAGLANIEAILSQGLVKESARKGKSLHNRLSKIKDKFPGRISYIFGKGLLAAIITRNPKDGFPDNLFASLVCERAMQKGLLLVHTGRESIKIGPPLTITDEALSEGLEVLEESIEEIDREILT